MPLNPLSSGSRNTRWNVRQAKSLIAWCARPISSLNSSCMSTSRLPVASKQDANGAIPGWR
ncbi:hypothetical protein [Photorhabdus luminescens]|uniref:hypothetical protein n=1 Tax=Photorhabdus luminescens TaxID=29488 RepID=UPI001C3CCD3E|nr:hypothetical protein [Photorhabdus luminescens]